MSFFPLVDVETIASVFRSNCINGDYSVAFIESDVTGIPCIATRWVCMPAIDPDWPRQAPDGFVTPSDKSELWRAVHVFQWSPVYDAWLDCTWRLTVKPNESVKEVLSAALSEHALSNARNDYQGFLPAGM